VSILTDSYETGTQETAVLSLNWILYSVHRKGKLGTANFSSPQKFVSAVKKMEVVNSMDVPLIAFR
jgi:hypothetical protein